MTTLWSESQGAANFITLASTKSCRNCKRHTFTEPIIIPTGLPFPHNVQISGEFAFHMSDTHGISTEETEIAITELIYQR